MRFREVTDLVQRGPAYKVERKGKLDLRFELRSSDAGASLVAQLVKNLPALQETQARSLGLEDSLEEGVATHCSILAWRIPWTEDLLGSSPWDRKQLDMTMQLTFLSSDSRALIKLVHFIASEEGIVFCIL